MAALGYGGSRTIPVARRGVLPGSRLLRAGVRRQLEQELRGARRVEGRVLGPGQLED